MKPLLITFLLCMMVFCGAAQESVAVASIRVLENDLDARVHYPVYDSNNELAALLKVVTPDPDFEFEFGTMGVAGDTQYKVGEYWVYVSAGTKAITVKHPAFRVLRNHPLPLIESGRVYEIVLAHGRVEKRIVAEKLITEWVVVETSPSGADLYLNNQPVGETRHQEEHRVGEYTYRIQLPRYKTKEGSFTLEQGKKVIINEILEPDFGVVVVQSRPESGASVYLDGINTGLVTPCELEVLKGQHVITLKSEWYVTTDTSIDVVEGQRLPIEVGLLPAFAEITITAPEDAEIYVKDEYKGKGTWTGQVRPGAVKIEAVNDHYRPDTKRIEVVAGDEKRYTLEPTLRTGTLRVFSEPIGAAVYIDGEQVGETPFSFRDQVIGEYTVSVAIDGYSDEKREVTIEEDDVKDVTFELQVEAWKVSRSVVRSTYRDVLLENHHTKTSGDGKLTGSMIDFCLDESSPKGQFIFDLREKTVKGTVEEELFLSRYRTKGNRSAVFASMILPGIGIQRVTYGRKSGALRFVPFALFSATSYALYRNQDDPNLRNYLGPRGGLEAAVVAGGIAASIYLIEFVQVLSIGGKNKKASADIRRRLKEGPIRIE